MPRVVVVQLMVVLMLMAMLLMVMQDDTIDQEAVFDLLYKKRAELAMSAPAIVSDFSVVLLGGKWTQQHRQVPFDFVMGKASGSTVESWCVQWGFQKSMRFGLTIFKFETAQLLARSWCAAMQYWYDLSQELNDADFRSSGASAWIPTEEFKELHRSAEGPLAQRCQRILAMRPGHGS